MKEWPPRNHWRPEVALVSRLYGPRLQMTTHVQAVHSKDSHQVTGFNVSPLPSDNTWIFRHPPFPSPEARPAPSATAGLESKSYGCTLLIGFGEFQLLLLGRWLKGGHYRTSKLPFSPLIFCLTPKALPLNTLQEGRGLLSSKAHRAGGIQLQSWLVSGLSSERGRGTGSPGPSPPYSP